MTNHIEELRTAMKRHGVKYFTAVTSDAHNSEYICEHDNAVKHISGFTGTNGRLAVTEDEAYLWTDGRYFIQAEKELEGSGIKLMKTGEPGVPDYKDWIAQRSDIAGEITAATDADITTEKLIDEIWTDRPARPAEPIWIHDIKWAGQTAEEKIAAVISKMQELKQEEIVINALDDIAWLLNLRGSDIPYNPVFYSFMQIRINKKCNRSASDATNTECNPPAADITIYLQPESLTDRVREYLTDLGIKIKKYSDFNTQPNAKTYSSIISEIKGHKTNDELAHMRESGLRDGVYMTKFIYWLKKQMPDIDEIDASDYLDALRAGDPNYISLSFPTISAYGPNAAIIHYRATATSRTKLQPRGLYLVDSGGQYLDGTTDVTRTIALGPLTEEEKKHYTLVCIGMLRAMNQKFTLPIDSTIIDKCARAPLRDQGLDFNHGTGHGVGYLGCVHENPARITRSRTAASAQGNQAAAAGQETAAISAQQNSAASAKESAGPAPYIFTGGETVSDEPGVYIEGSHGVRIENMIAVPTSAGSIKSIGTSGSDTYSFECLTWVPLEREALDTSLMTETDIQNFNDYQNEVKRRIAPYLSEDERKWLDEI